MLYNSFTFGLTSQNMLGSKKTGKCDLMWRGLGWLSENSTVSNWTSELIPFNLYKYNHIFCQYSTTAICSKYRKITNQFNLLKKWKTIICINRSSLFKIHIIVDEPNHLGSPGRAAFWKTQHPNVVSINFHILNTFSAQLLVSFD